MGWKKPVDLSAVLALYRAGLLCHCSYYCMKFLCIHFSTYISRIKERVSFIIIIMKVLIISFNFFITDSVDLSLGKLWELVMGREAWNAAVHRITKRQDWATELNFNFLWLGKYKSTLWFWTHCRLLKRYSSFHILKEINENVSENVALDSQTRSKCSVRHPELWA